MHERPQGRLWQGLRSPAVLEHRAIRPLGLRRRGRIAVLLRHPGEGAHRSPGRHDCRNHSEPLQVEPGEAPRASTTRRDIVLGVMLEQGMITNTEYWEYTHT